ncbi:MAG: ROK family protein, partial [Micromonosporaceae bacterium]
PVVTAAEVAARAAEGEPAAVAVWRETVDALADGLLTAITLFDPELIVLGGGLAEAGGTLLRPLTAALETRRTFEAAPRLTLAALGDQAGCLGAALIAVEILKSDWAVRPTDPQDPGDNRKEARR